jgi:hypothetical protein
VTHRSNADRLGKFLVMGDWGRRWRKESGRARAQREAEQRELPSVLEAHEVEAFRAQWDRVEIAPAEQELEELEAVAGWGQEVWRKRGLMTPAKGAPEGSEWEGRASSDVLGRCKFLASEAESIILGSLVAAAGRLHPAGDGRSRQVRRGGGKSRWRRVVGKLNKALAAAWKEKWHRMTAVVRSTQGWDKPVEYPGEDKKAWVRAAVARRREARVKQRVRLGREQLKAIGRAIAKRGDLWRAGAMSQVLRPHVAWPAYWGVGYGHDGGRPTSRPPWEGAKTPAAVF